VQRHRLLLLLVLVLRLRLRLVLVLVLVLLVLVLRLLLRLLLVLLRRRPTAAALDRIADRRQRRFWRAHGHRRAGRFVQHRVRSLQALGRAHLIRLEHFFYVRVVRLPLVVTVLVVHVDGGPPGARSLNTAFTTPFRFLGRSFVRPRR